MKPGIVLFCVGVLSAAAMDFLYGGPPVNFWVGVIGRGVVFSVLNVAGAYAYREVES